MKAKMTCMLLTGLFFLLIVSAQFTPGIKAGVSFAHLSGFTGNDRVGVHGGLFLHHTIDAHWCVQPEILYSSEGQRYFDAGEERTLALNYIQVPVMIQYYATRQFYFEAGPQFGLLINAQDKGNDGDFNAKSDFPTGQVGINIGLGMNFTHQVGIYGRYCFGLTDVSKFDNIVDHSQVGQIGLAVRFNH